MSPPYPLGAPGERRGVFLPHAPVLVAGYGEVAWLSPDGEIEALSAQEARARVLEHAPILCHARAAAARLDAPAFPSLDVLELFAFVRPARFCIPTPRGLAEALALPVPKSLSQSCLTLAEAARALLEELDDEKGSARAIAAAMGRGGWLWAEAVLAALPPAEREDSAGLSVWNGLSEWSDTPAGRPHGNREVTAAEARARLNDLLGADAEPRPQQEEYAGALAAAFAPHESGEGPNAVIAEAGTGVGKTLGYIAPASLWAERNGGPVVISTFTRNLQSQIVSELARLYPDPAERRRRVALRKGRENFLCLLNYEEAASAAASPWLIALGLVARWTAASEAGDLFAGDFPGWLSDLVGRGRISWFSDRRGECIHSACPHFRRCFVEKNKRRAREARIVVANHALVLGEAVRLDEARASRYIFDEGHHLIDAADNAFAIRLSAAEGRELRRWIVGAESLFGGRARGRSRARGLRRRIGDLVADDGDAERALLEALLASRILPGEGWAARISEGQAVLGAESFFAFVLRHVLARASEGEGGYGLEAEARPAEEPLLAAASDLALGLDRLAAALTRLAARLRERLEDEKNPPDPALRQRLEAILSGLRQRVEGQIDGWRGVLRDLHAPASPETVEWFALDRRDGVMTDIAAIRAWIDPGLPFCRLVAEPAHGLVVTSATLYDSVADTAEAFDGALAATGLRHLPRIPAAIRVASPFDYAKKTRIFVVTDVPRDDLAQVAGAYARLFLASRGGALGLFTAVLRLKAVHERIAPALEAADLLLLAQHVEAMSTASLVEIFRAEEDSCLLGTDAVRDGVDVPGRSLRLIVFDRVPWPRPDILHRARRAAFGGREYEERITRQRLRQAYGRLIRRAGDRGVFIVLDRRLPSRLLSAFPEGVSVGRVPLAEAVAATAEFLAAQS